MNRIDHRQRPVILGTGILPIGQHWEISLRQLGGRAVRMALQDAGNPKPDAIYIGNGLGTILSHQANLGALIPEFAGYPGIESCTFEAAGASGAAAFQAACFAVESGYVDVAVALGVEKITECEDRTAEAAMNLALNYEFESSQGLTVKTEAALIAQRYLYEWHLKREIFQNVALNSYQNARGNLNAFARNIDEKAYQKQPMISGPLGLYDIAAQNDGAAAVVLTREELVPAEEQDRLIIVSGSGNAIASLALHDRHDFLHWSAAGQSAATALRQADLYLSDIDIFEIWDGTVMDVILSLESIGICQEGKGWQIDSLPLNVTGGCLGRGNPLGASGMYQIAEIARFLQTQKSKDRIHRNALIQAIGGYGATAITHILRS
ncbi:MAG TPA: beta-ketoacyl synthase N-terminal-like domain-containing protein [Flexilinea sp.]|nr:beta-ketoacyl synthase N-terminal-like domain-containing protein [Flexilinea sp.]